jgi:hypothetical protein
VFSHHYYNDFLDSNNYKSNFIDPKMSDNKKLSSKKRKWNYNIKREAKDKTKFELKHKKPITSTYENPGLNVICVKRFHFKIFLFFCLLKCLNVKIVTQS